VPTTNRLLKVSAIALCAVVGCASGQLTDQVPDDDAMDAGDMGTDSATTADGSSTRDVAAHDSGQIPMDATGGGDSPVSAPPDAAVDATAPDSSSATDGAPPPLDAAPTDASSVDSLIGKWSFDEGTGTTSADLSGLGHTATLVGAATWTASGKEGAGLALDGTTGFADVGIRLIDTAQSFSVLCWAKLAVVNSWEVVASQDDVTGSLFGLKLRGDGTDAFDFDVEMSDATNPPFIVAQSTVTAQAQTWVHLAGVYDTNGAGTLTIYVNGMLQESAAIGSTVMASTGHFVIGRGLYDAVTGSFVNGIIDEVEVHSAALTSAQVAAVYEAEQ
jgi:hypothetical protein